MRLSASLPVFPWDTLADVTAVARAHPDGIVDLSVGTPVDEVAPVIRTALADARTCAKNIVSAFARGMVATENNACLNTELNQYNAEASRLETELSRIAGARNMDDAKWELMAAAVGDLANLGDAIKELQAHNNLAGLTNLILSQVQAVVCNDRAKGAFEIIPALAGRGSHNGIKWRPERDSNPRPPA